MLLEFQKGVSGGFISIGDLLITGKQENYTISKLSVKKLDHAVA